MKQIEKRIEDLEQAEGDDQIEVVVIWSPEEASDDPDVKVVTWPGEDRDRELS